MTSRVFVLRRSGLPGGRTVGALAAIVGAALLSGCVVPPMEGGYASGAYYDNSTVVYTRYGYPPPPRVEYRTVSPSADYLWIGGGWDWNGRRYDWRPGRWDPPHYGPGPQWRPQPSRPSWNPPGPQPSRPSWNPPGPQPSQPSWNGPPPRPRPDAPQAQPPRPGPGPGGRPDWVRPDRPRPGQPEGGPPQAGRPQPSQPQPGQPQRPPRQDGQQAPAERGDGDHYWQRNRERDRGS